MARSSRFTGVWMDRENSQLEMYVDGTLVGTFDNATADLVLPTNGLQVAAGTLNIDGAADFAADVKFNLTITAGADGVGADGEQLTSGGAAAECDWAAAASRREFKNIQRERTDADAVLDILVNTPVYDFKYKEERETPDGLRIMSTGDTDTVYTGVMADEAPWAVHYHGNILNPINTFGYTVLAIKALAARIEELEEALIWARNGSL